MKKPDRCKLDSTLRFLMAKDEYIYTKMVMGKRFKNLPPQAFQALRDRLAAKWRVDKAIF